MKLITLAALIMALQASALHAEQASLLKPPSGLKPLPAAIPATGVNASPITARTPAQFSARAVAGGPLSATARLDIAKQMLGSKKDPNAPKQEFKSLSTGVSTKLSLNTPKTAWATLYASGVADIRFSGNAMVFDGSLIAPGPIPGYASPVCNFEPPEDGNYIVNLEMESHYKQTFVVTEMSKQLPLKQHAIEVDKGQQQLFAIVSGKKAVSINEIGRAHV